MRQQAPGKAEQPGIALPGTRAASCWQRHDCSFETPSRLSAAAARAAGGGKCKQAARRTLEFRRSFDLLNFVLKKHEEEEFTKAFFSCLIELPGRGPLVDPSNRTRTGVLVPQHLGPCNEENPKSAGKVTVTWTICPHKWARDFRARVEYHSIYEIVGTRLLCETIDIDLARDFASATALLSFLS